jgi:Flp pilus assembly protein TadB
VDPEILAHERKQAEEKTRQAEAAFDIDEVYREEEHADPFSLDDLRAFRFTTRHLLIVTALLAVVLTAIREGKCFGGFLVGIVALAAGWFFVLNKEKRERQRRQQLREEKKQRIAAARGEAETVDYVPAEIVEPEPSLVPAFKFSFSMKEMLGAFTVAAVTFGLMSIFGNPTNVALFLGAIALLGLIVHQIGFDPPPVVVLGWWLLLVLYIVLSVWAAFSPAPVAWIEGGSSLMMGFALRA